MPTQAGDVTMTLDELHNLTLADLDIEPNDPIDDQPTDPEPQEPQTPSGEDDWKASVDSADTRKLAAHPKVQGLIGDLAQKLFKDNFDKEFERKSSDLRKQWEQEQRTASDDQLLRNDPVAYRDQLLERQTEEEIRSQYRDELHNEFWTDVDSSLLHALFYEMPEAVQQKVAGTEYKGEPLEARKAYFKHMMDEYGRYINATSRQRWEKEAMPALEAKVRLELAGNGPKITSGKAPHVEGTYSDAEIQAMSPAEFMQKFDGILSQVE